MMLAEASGRSSRSSRVGAGGRAKNCSTKMDSKMMSVSRGARNCATAEVLVLGEERGR
jgi:hypothetical protein